MGAAMAVGGHAYEHLGQLIAYARSSGVVPPGAGRDCRLIYNFQDPSSTGLFIFRFSVSEIGELLTAGVGELMS